MHRNGNKGGNMKINIPVVETIKKRKSIRTYEERQLSEDDRRKLMKYIDEVTNPFGVKVNIHVIEKGLNPKGEKLGTYGMIKGASTFLGITVENTEFCMEAVGYQIENLVLYATDMGLGTVWLAATFNRNGFASAMGLKDDTLFPALLPIGYPADKKSFQESTTRKMLQADKRKPWDKLFFKDNYHTPLTEKEAAEYALPLEMLRLAPSATNAQPWRVVKQGEIYHFYETHRGGTVEEKMIKRVDVGIALSHFQQTALDKNLSGRFEKLSIENIEAPANTNYIISWISNTN